MLVTKTVTLAEKIYNLTFDPNGTVEVRIHTGILDELGVFTEIPGTVRLYTIPSEATATVLDVVPTDGLTRRNDIGKIIFEYLLSIGVITGTLV